MTDPIEMEVIEYPVYMEGQEGGARGWWSAIRVDGGYIQAKYEYETDWTNLVALSDLIGPQGVTFTPHLSGDGTLSWTNDGGLDNPTSVNIKGDKGDPGNMTGPASSVDGNIPVFDGIAGDKVKDSGAKLSDKADVDDVADALALKADKTYVDTNLATKAPLTSPALTGTPTAPIAPQGTNTNQIATTAHVFLAMMEGDWA